MIRCKGTRKSGIRNQVSVPINALLGLIVPSPLGMVFDQAISIGPRPIATRPRLLMRPPREQQKVTLPK